MTIIGTWHLIEWVMVGHDNSQSHPFSDRASGRILYGSDGIMGGFLMHPDWPMTRPDAGDPADYFIAYSGRYRLVDDVVTHHVDIASQPSWVGTSLARRIERDGEALVLTTIGSTDLAVSSWRHHRLRFQR